MNAANLSMHPGRNPTCQLLAGDDRHQRWYQVKLTVGSLILTIPAKITRTDMYCKGHQRTLESLLKGTHLLPYPTHKLMAGPLSHFFSWLSPSSQGGGYLPEWQMSDQMKQKETQRTIPGQEQHGRDFL